MQKVHKSMTIEPKIPRKMNWGRVAPYLLISPWVLGFLIFTFGPLLFSLVISFFNWPIIGESHFVGFGNYIEMFTDDSLFWKSLGITIKSALIFVPINLILALFLAVLLNQSVRVKSLFRTIFYLPSIISGVALAMIWAWVFSGEFGILNYFLDFLHINGPDWLNSTRWSLGAIIIASLWGQGPMMLIFLAGLQSVPKDLHEAASLDGAGAFKRFFRITIPLLTPTLLFNLITSIITAFQQLTLALLLTSGGPVRSTYYYAMYVYENAFKYFKMGYSAANAWFMFLIILSLTMLVFKSSAAWVYYESDLQNVKQEKQPGKGV